MHEDEDNVNTMLVPLDPPSAVSPQGRNQDMDHSDELQPNPLPNDIRGEGMDRLYS